MATKLEKRDIDAAGSLDLVRWALLGTAALSIALALLAGSVITLWKTLGSLGTPVLLLPLALAHTRQRLSAPLVTISMVAAGAASGLWLLAGRGGAWLGIEAIFPGLAVSIVFVGWAFLRRPRD